MDYGIDNYDWIRPLGGGCGYIIMDNGEIPAPTTPPTTSGLDQYICYVDTIDRLKDALKYRNQITSGHCTIVFRSIPTAPDNYSPELDFTNRADLPFEIPANTTLFGYRGDSYCEGALLFTRDQNLPALFKITGPGVLIKGLRFGGYDLESPRWAKSPDFVQSKMQSLTTINFNNNMK